MKRILLIAGAALLLLLCWRLIHQAPGSQDANSTEGGTAQAATVQHEITKSSPVQSGTAVFQRAFWKRPTLDDTILQAELREWTDEENIPHWQWFIVLEPSADLLKDFNHVTNVTQIRDILKNHCFIGEKAGSEDG